MMNTKQRLYSSISIGAKAAAFVLLMLVSACGGQEEPDVEKEDKLQLSDQEITLKVDGWKPMAESRANIFDTENDFLYESAGKGGGYFALHAYMRETGNTFISGAKVWYYTYGKTPAWRFLSGNDLIDYYWPQNESVDFFACMPYSNSQRQKNITVGQYEKGTGLNLTCQMQQSVGLEDAEGQETIIAYTEDKSKTAGSVNMHFVHPFSAVKFELKQAHRDLTINWIRFNNVYLTGSTTLDETTTDVTKIEWTSAGEPSTFEISVGRKIPDEINFGGEIGGPYLVMPQDLADATITINYTWDNAKAEDDVVSGDENTNTKDHIYQITRPINAEWIAGNKYTYILNLGNNEAEILFKVLVEPWQPVGKDNIIDVE